MTDRLATVWRRQCHVKSPLACSRFWNGIHPRDQTRLSPREETGNDGAAGPIDGVEAHTRLWTTKGCTLPPKS
jgi:hypothetical protein